MERGAKATLLFFFAGVLMCSTAEAQYRCVEGDCINGKGKKVLENGPGGMEGEFVEGVLAKGKAVFPNGDVFEGLFVNNQIVDGTKRFKDGRIYAGKFFSNILIDGRITEADGSSRDVKLTDLNAPKDPRKPKSPFEK